jgi:hypothetical protein
MLRLGDDQVDLRRFRGSSTGRAAASPQEASALLREALGLWRGRPLADLEGAPLHRDAAARLDDARLDALEARVDADLRRGAHGELTASCARSCAATRTASGCAAS